MNYDDLNNYVPSLLNPRTVPKAADLSLTQNSILSRYSLSLKREVGSPFGQKISNKVTPLNKHESKKNDGVLQQQQNNIAIEKNLISASGGKSVIEREKTPSKIRNKAIGKENIQKIEKKSSKIPNKTTDKENIQNSQKLTVKSSSKLSKQEATIENISISFSAIDDIITLKNDDLHEFGDNIEIPTKKLVAEENNTSLITVSSAKASIDDICIDITATEDLTTFKNYENSNPFSFGDVEILTKNVLTLDNNGSLTTVLPANELNDNKFDLTKVPLVISFGIRDCEKVDLSTKNTSIKKALVTRKENITNIDCELLQNSHISLSDSGTDENMSEVQHSQHLQKRSAVAVNLEIKKKRLSQHANDGNEDSKVLILNTDDIDKVTHVSVHPPNYKLVKKQIQRNSKSKNIPRKSCVRNGGCVRNSGDLKQRRIDSYFRKSVDVLSETLGLPKPSGDNQSKNVGCGDGAVMSKNLGVVESQGAGAGAKSAGRRREEASPRSSKLRARESDTSRAALRGSQSDARRVASAKQDSPSSSSPRRHLDPVHFSLTTKTKSIKSTLSPRNIPFYKIVAGTHFAVDAFSYGDIPNVKRYFLTHFHSDHYAGLKKSFNKILFCSKITAELCMTRIGVNAKNIHVINNDETFTIDGIEVTAVDANHCPGAVMLVFSLPNGKTVLHTGDFRASPEMESYPIFWNKNITTIYLDTTYCNPRYDFPTQDESLEMALYQLRQKKMQLEKTGKKFSSVLIVCGTYTIGKEKFFLGMARRVGCSVWACPEKDRVLRAVEGRSFSHAPAHSCQLHVVPMRDLVHEKLRSYLDSLNGAFSEVVAFKPSGWENGKNSTVERDGVTIHGIPYSEHSSFSELIRFVKFLKPRQVLPTVDISGGAKSVQKYFPCPIVCQEELMNQTKITDCFSIQSRPHAQGSAVT